MTKELFQSKPGYLIINEKEDNLDQSMVDQMIDSYGGLTSHYLNYGILRLLKKPLICDNIQ